MSAIRHRRRGKIPTAKQPSVSVFQSSRNFDGTSKRGSVGGSSRTGLTGVRVSGAEADAILQELANTDDYNKKTWSRMVVESFLSKQSWYFPRLNDPNAPSLSKAWAYYEHVTLPRHFSGDTDVDHVKRRAEPGEHDEETQLYDIWKTSQSSLIEWGTGIDLYFISLRFFAVVMLIAGLMNISSIMYFASDEYNGDNGDQTGFTFDLNYPLQGSAVCENQAWVVCTDCIMEEGGDDPEQDWYRDPLRFAEGLDQNGNLTVLVKRNLCDAFNRGNGFTNFATMIFVLVSVGIFSYYLRLREIRFDEDKVTTTDYSVVVENPPPDALDPDVWQDFFDQFATDGGQVTVVTVALNNELLIRKLLQRRNFRNQLRWKLPEDTDLDDEAAVRVAVDKFNQDRALMEVGCVGKILDCIVIPVLNIINMMLPPDELVEKITKLMEEIKELQNEKYDANRIFVTFETEEGQRTALESLDVGRVDLLLNRTGAVAPECLLDGKILKVTGPTEPNAVRWLDLSYGKINKSIRRLVVLVLTLGMIALASLAVSKTRDSLGAKFSGPLTTIFNSTIPQIIKLLMMIEPHATEGGFQTSLYLKITLFRWTLSAILTQVITPNTSTLGGSTNDLLPTIYAILLSDVWLSPLLRLSDWMTNFFKHVMGPRANTQEEMNRNFQGTYYNLGERYTDFTKILFVVFFYSALFPSGFFFGFVILTFQYLTDKFSLLRIWGWAPFIGSELAVFSRRFFFSGAAITLAVVSSYVWAQFPYDNVCDPEEVMSGLAGMYTNVTTDNGKEDVNGTGVVYVTQDTNVIYCSQSWRDYDGFKFPATPRLQTSDPSWTASVDSETLEWMNDSQTLFTLIYGWFTVFVVFVFVVGVFGKTIHGFIVSIFIGSYKVEGASQHIDFSSNPEIFAYVPQIKQIGQPFPYLACDIDDIDQGLVGWNDASHSYDFYNLIFDIPHKSLRRTRAIEKNTRGVDRITKHAQYDDGSQPVEVLSVGTEPSQAGYEVSERDLGRPIYSQIKHYPTKWQLELQKKQETEGILKEEDRI